LDVASQKELSLGGRSSDRIELLTTRGDYERNIPEVLQLLIRDIAP
jgi:hypothetical protein